MSHTTYAPAARTRLYRRPSLRTLAFVGLGLKASTPLRYLLAPPSSLQHPLYAFGAVRSLGRDPFPELLSTFLPTPWIRNFVGSVGERVILSHPGDG